MSINNTRLLVFAFLILLISGVFTGIYAIGIFFSAKESENWPSETGIIIQSDIIRRSNEGRVTYYPKIEYEYIVDGKKFANKDIFVGGMGEGGNESKAESIIELYPVGKQAPVYYDPEKPQVSALIIGINYGHYFMFIIPGFFIIFGVYGIFNTELFIVQKRIVKNKDAKMDESLNNPTKACKSCQTSNPDEAIFCVDCGKIIE